MYNIGKSLIIPLGSEVDAYMPDDLKDSGFLLRNLMENIPDYLYVKDSESRFIIVNKAFCAWTGMEPVDMIGKTDFELISKEHAEKAFAQEQHIISSGQPLIGIEEMETWPDGHITWVSTTKMPLTNDAGDVIGTFGISRNITETKELQGQLVQAQKLESVGHLAAGIAHEINTPIQFVGDNLRFLQESVADLLALTQQYAAFVETAKASGMDTAVIEQQLQALKAADTEYLKEELPIAIKQSLEGAERVSKIVRAMKEFSHPGSTEMSSANLNEAIETTITVAKNEWKYIAKITKNFAKDLPPVPCLVSEFNQVILNMIVNARDAIEETGQNGTITFSTSYDDQWAIVRICDSGAGMPESVQKRIFDPFFTTKEVGKGSGQGLAIAHNVIVNKHDGKLSVQSQQGKGTVFEIKLPLKRSKENG
jgi:PAS domain S-box-containing protein